MNTLKRCGLVLAVLIFTTNTWATELDTEEKKLGYIIGMDIGKSLRDQGTEVDLDSLVDAIRATYNDEELAMTVEEAGQVRKEYIEKMQAKKQAEAATVGQTNLVAGQKFLAENATKEGVQTTASGLQYKVVTMGTGAKPAATDTVKVHYRGTLLDGTEFDSSYARNEPISFALNRVIPGWTEGVQLMPVGSKFMFYIAPDLAYGEGGGGPIPPNSTLEFEVELLDIEASE
ncbi:MAG: FKBP-type peptidyl-prolyl cis-trans isomerase [Xanthomonadales bacterium]|nr:FKBP-type peptidyl-prolyl cis-trans isomerase [Xanthomonadales bacterium]